MGESSIDRENGYNIVTFHGSSARTGCILVTNIGNSVLLPGFDSTTTLKPLVNGDAKSDLLYKQVLS